MFDHFVPAKVAVSLVPCNIFICSDPTWLRIPGDGKKGIYNAKIFAAYEEGTLFWAGVGGRGRGTLRPRSNVHGATYWEPLGMQMHSRLLAPS